LIGFYIFYTICSVLFVNAIIDSTFKKEFLGFRIFTIVEGILLMAFLRRVIENFFAKKLIIGFALFFIVFSVVDLNNSRSDSFDSIPAVIECIIILGFSMFYFYEQLKNPQSLFLYSTPNFWIVVGLIIFFAGNFFVFIYAQSNSESAEFKNTFDLINTILSFIENILFLIAFIIARQQSKTIKSNIVAKTT
jgi:hypothetical protein